MLIKKILHISIKYILHIIFFLLLLLVPGLLHAQETGVIEGQVIIGRDGALPTGLSVELLFLPNGQGPPVITKEPLAEDGLFRFNEIDTAPQHRYLVRVKVDGEDNFSDLLDFTNDETSKQVTLRLFERTTDASALSLQEVNYILDQQSGGWAILGFYRYQNTGEQTILNLTNPPAFFPLPAEAANVQFVEGIEQDSVVELADGFAYTGPFAPGELSMIFSYLYPYNEGSQTLTLPLGTNSGTVRVLIPKLGQTTTTDDMISVGEQEFEGIVFEIFEKANSSADDLFIFRFEELPAAPPTAETQIEPKIDNTNPRPSPSTASPLQQLEQLPWWSPLVLMGTAAFLAVGYIMVRPAQTSAEKRINLLKRRDRLITEIVSLDLRFESGAIGEQTHLRQRHILKQELKEVLRDLGMDDQNTARRAPNGSISTQNGKLS